ncbi:hypothetical protein T484DRAFT_1763891 [Baffinella frigidus]|nr:hypothetical protein T484DRAFT_1763891 [Cryptophyta sp. CCMP2293]
MPNNERAFISKEFLASQPVALVVSFVPLAPTQPASTLRVFPVAALEDPSERLVTVASSLVTATLLQCAPADLLNCSAVTVVPLIGTKSKQTVDGKCYRFKFDAPGLLGGLSTLFDVQIGSFLSLLEVVQQPVGATAGGSFNLQPQLVALDGGLNVMTTLSSLAVSASLLVGASKVDFHTSSRRSQTFDAGLATYTDLRVDGAGCCNRITFEANAKTTVSNVFCVKPGAPSHLALARPPSEPAVGWHFGVQPVVHLEDAYGNKTVVRIEDAYGNQPVVHLEDAYGNKVDGTNCVYSCERLTANISATISEVEQDATANLPFDPVGTLLGNRRARKQGV